MSNFKSKTLSFDFKGFLIFGAASLSLSIALELLGNTVHITPILSILILGFVLLYLYYRHAKKDSDPIFPLNLFQIRTFRIGSVVMLATLIGIISIPFF